MGDIDDREIVEEVLFKLQTNQYFIISYEEYCRFIDKLVNLLSIYHYRVIIVNNNLYHSFYPAPYMITTDRISQ